MKKILFAISISAVLFAGCKKVNINESEGKGTVSFKIGMAENSIYVTKSSLPEPDPATFVISIKSEDGSYSETWTSYSELPSVLELVSGNYTVAASSPANEAVAWEQPVYGGSKDFTVVVGKVSNVDLECTITNMMVTMNPTQDFLDELTSFEVTVKSNDGSLIWTRDEVTADKAGFFAVSPLEIWVKGTRYNGQTAAQQYLKIDNVAARDHHIINLDAKVTGSLEGIQLVVDSSVNDREENISVPGFEEIPVEGGEDGGDVGGEDGGDGQIDAPTLEWASNPTFATIDIEDGMSVDLVIKAPGKIKSVIVRVSDNFKPAIQMITSDGSDYLDLVNVNINESMSAGLAEAGLTMGEDLLDKTEAPMSLSSLVPMISQVGNPGEDYVFTLEVTDGQGQNLTKVLTFHNPEK